MIEIFVSITKVTLNHKMKMLLCPNRWHGGQVILKLSMATVDKLLTLQNITMQKEPSATNTFQITGLTIMAQENQVE